MKSTWTLNENSTGKLIVEVEPKAWQEAQEKAMDALIKNVEIEGFRKGHAPKKLAAKQVNPQSVMLDAVNVVANDAFVAGIVEHKLEPVSQPALDIQAMTQEALTLTFDITIKPEVELGEYKGIKVKAEEIVVTDEEVEHELTHIQEENAEFVVVEEGVVEDGNTVVIDFEGFKDGEAFEGGKGENYSLEIGSNSFIPGFEEALIGLKSGEEKDIELSFPEGYHVEELAGQPVVFHVVLHEVKVRELPEINDDLVALLEDESISTLDELKAKIKHDLEHQREHQEEDRVNDVLVNTIIENAKVDVPEVMITEELDQMFNEFNQRLAQQGMNFELYSQILNQTEEDVKEQMKEDADKRVRTRLVLEKIADVEGLKAEEEDVEKEYESISQMYGIELDQVKQIVSVEAVTYELLLRKAIELVQSTRV
ncbi:trigger factor [Erysipelothrix larvae]|uniref:Trigger factor n=1 Tax=Erysipelothrix larvae TaxID=1514105 RepID=A0A120JTI7_9FIRM|nr:trigger factor [Erysipelothrix larvae]AMC92985.1 trigger factor [Erysipelothrix larvae]